MAAWVKVLMPEYWINDCCMWRCEAIEGHVYYIEGQKCIDVATSEAFQMGCKMVKLLQLQVNNRDELDKYVDKIWELVSWPCQNVFVYEAAIHGSPTSWLLCPFFRKRVCWKNPQAVNYYTASIKCVTSQLSRKKDLKTITQNYLPWVQHPMWS